MSMNDPHDCDGWQRCEACDHPIDLHNQEDVASFDKDQICCYCAEMEREFEETNEELQRWSRI